LYKNLLYNKLTSAVSERPIISAQRNMCCQLSDNMIIRQYRCLNSLTLQTLSILCIETYTTLHFGDSISTPSPDLIFPKQNATTYVCFVFMFVCFVCHGLGMWCVWGRGEVCTGCWWGGLREGDHWGDPDVDERIILRGIFRKWEGILGTGWSGLRIGTGGGHL
jgi:hypothetical protein